MPLPDEFTWMVAGLKAGQRRTRQWLLAQSWVQGQDPKGLAQHSGPQAQHANADVAVAVVDHAQVDVHPGGDADQTLHHDYGTRETVLFLKVLLVPMVPDPESRPQSRRVFVSFTCRRACEVLPMGPPYLAPPRPVTNME